MNAGVSVLPVQGHVRPPVVVPFHEPACGILSGLGVEGIAHVGGSRPDAPNGPAIGGLFKAVQLSLDLPVQPLQLAIRLGVADPRQYLAYVQLDQPLLEPGDALALLIGLVGVELRADDPS